MKRYSSKDFTMKNYTKEQKEQIAKALRQIKGRNEQVWKKIQQLDLSSVFNRFVKKRGWLWHLGKSVSEIDKEYRKFLCLNALEQGVVPWSQDLDDYWHEHILDTKKYAKDCEEIFGFFLHHNPTENNQGTEHKTKINKTDRLRKSVFRNNRFDNRFIPENYVESDPDLLDLVNEGLLIVGEIILDNYYEDNYNNCRDHQLEDYSSNDNSDHGFTENCDHGTFDNSYNDYDSSKHSSCSGSSCSGSSCSSSSCSSSSCSSCSSSD